MLDNDELRATRKLHGQDDGMYRETSDKNVANDKDYTLAYLKGYADAEEKYRQKVKDKIEKIFTVLYENYENDYEDIQDVISEIHIKLKKELLEENSNDK